MCHIDVDTLDGKKKPSFVMIIFYFVLSSESRKPTMALEVNKVEEGGKKKKIMFIT